MHGLGGAKDLPVPAPLAIAGGTAALIVSFAVLVVAWRKPRYAALQAGRPLPPTLARLIGSEGWRWTLRVLGLAFTAWFVWGLVSGPDLVTNPIFGSFYVLLWVGIVPASLLFGRIFRAVSPVRTVNLLFARATGGDPARGVTTYPEGLGYWPAAVGLFGFVWLELVSPHSAYIGPVRVWLGGGFPAWAIGGALFCRTRVARAHPLW